MKEVLNQVSKERIAQNKKWGEQNHTPIEWIGILTEELLNYRKELIQVAAVAVQAIECIDRNYFDAPTEAETPPNE